MANADGSRQFIAYSNDVATSIPGNAMILPVPYPETIQLHDLSKFQSLFSDLKECFPSFSLRNAYTDGAQESFLSTNQIAVHNVGSYQVSICNNINDFDRINRSVFTLNPVVKSILAKYYSGFGFIVCQLRIGSAEYHPLGYSHRIYSSKGYMFVPTRHHHSGSSEEVESDWDHEIYSINTTDHAGDNGSTRPGILAKISALTGVTVPNVHNIRRLTLNGVIRNSDVFLGLRYGRPSRTRFLGVDGCVFTANDMTKIHFMPGLMSSKPVVYLDGKHYYFGFNVGTPLLFYGTRVNFEVGESGVKVVDEVGAQNEKTYNFKLKNAGMAPDGKLYLIA